MTICRTIVAGLLGLLTALAMTPAAYAGDARTFFGVVDGLADTGELRLPIHGGLAR